MNSPARYFRALSIIKADNHRRVENGYLKIFMVGSLQSKLFYNSAESAKDKNTNR